MPKSKETISDSESSGSSSEQEKAKSKPKKQEKKKPQSSASEASESEEETKSKKRTKKGNDVKGSTNKKAKKDSKSNNDEESWDIGGNKMVTVRPFKGKWYVDIREQYMDKGSGEMKPTKKGVFMNQETWKQLKNVMSEVDECLKSKC